MLEEPMRAAQTPPSAIEGAVLMFVQAFLKSRSRKEGEAFMAELKQLVDDQEVILPFDRRGRPTPYPPDVLEFVRRAWPLLVASMPPKGRR